MMVGVVIMLLPFEAMRLYICHNYFDVLKKERNGSVILNFHMPVKFQFNKVLFMQKKVNEIII